MSERVDGQIELLGAFPAVAPTVQPSLRALVWYMTAVRTLCPPGKAVVGTTAASLSWGSAALTQIPWIGDGGQGVRPHQCPSLGAQARALTAAALGAFPVWAESYRRAG